MWHPIGDPLAPATGGVWQISTIDAGPLNDQFFINVASGGFGAGDETPPELKKHSVERPIHLWVLSQQRKQPHIQAG